MKSTRPAQPYRRPPPRNPPPPPLNPPPRLIPPLQLRDAPLYERDISDPRERADASRLRSRETSEPPHVDPPPRDPPPPSEPSREGRSDDAGRVPPSPEGR